MYSFICAVLCVLFIGAAVFKFLKISEKKAAALGRISLVSSAVGIILLASAAASFFVNLSKAGLVPEDREWISDTLTSYALTCAVFAVAVVAFTLISSFAQPKFKVLRILIILLASILILISGFLFSFISSNDKLTVSGYVKLISIGAALFVQSGGFRDFRS